MTDHKTLSLEATKLVKEWSVWMVAVQSALIGFLITAKPAGGSLDACTQLALVCFGISVLAAAWVLSALPYILIRLAEEEDANIYFLSLSSAPLLRLVPMWFMGAVQHWTFGVGMVLLIGGGLLHEGA